MNGFKIKKIQSLTLGEKMKKVRDEKRIGLPEIAKNTKIQLEYLEYLENGNYNKLPADVYVRGFLKSFADYLGINEGYLIKLFNKEKSIQKNIQGNNSEKIKPQEINLSRFSINPKVISIALSSLFFLVLAIYLYNNFSSFVSEPALIILNPSNDSNINSSTVLVKGKTDAGNNLFINNQAVLVDDDGIFEEELVLREGINTIVVKSVNQFNKEAVKSLSIEANYKAPEEINPPEDSPPVEENIDQENNIDSTQSDTQLNGEMEASKEEDNKKESKKEVK